MRSPILFLLLGILASCGGKKEESAEAKGPSQAELDQAVTAANKAVPADLGTSVEFAIYREPKKARYVAIVPKGWEESDVMPGSFEAPDVLGSMTRFRVGTNCDGTCEPKDWAATAEKINFKQLRSGTIEKEEELPGGGKLIISKKSGSTYVSLARWSDKGRFYLTCYANLETKAATLVTAAETACKAMATDRW